MSYKRKYDLVLHILFIVFFFVELLLPVHLDEHCLGDFPPLGIPL